MGKGVVGVIVAEFSSHSPGQPKELINHLVSLLQSTRTRETFRSFRDSSFAQLSWNASRSRGTSSRDMSGASLDIVVQGLGLDVVKS